MNLVIANRQRTKKINRRFLKAVVSAVVAELKITEAELGISLVGAREMTLVNETFLSHEGSTDVITFDHAEAPAGQRQTVRKIYGELFVCVDEALLQAKAFGTRWQSEVVRYVVHGILHLLGYDDLRPDLRRTMKREENRLMRWLAKRFALAELSSPVKIAR